jgi:hypothetical protein
MRTEIRNENGLIVKKAESTYDKKMLLKIANNIDFINHNFPEFMQEVVYVKEYEVGLRAAPGTCLFAPEAFIEYPQNEWIVESIISYLNRIQKEPVMKFSGLFTRMDLIKPFIKGLLVGCRYPLELMKHIVAILVGNHRWVYSHGDFTENNFAIDYEQQSVWIIDWENFGIRPKYYDDFYLIFHHCIPILDMGWQAVFINKKLKSDTIDQLLKKETHSVAIYVLFLLYYFETFRIQRPEKVVRTGKFPGKSTDYFEQRALTRYNNLVYLLSFDNWISWISSFAG